MIGRVIRVLFGFIVASLAAGLALVLFVNTPNELAAEMSGDRLSETGVLALAVGTQAAVFAAPFAFIGAALSEWKGYANWLYSAAVGVIIAVIGFAVQYAGEAGGIATILNSYALAAFIVAGLVGGLVYWLLAGAAAKPAAPPPPSEDKPLPVPFAIKKPDASSA